MRVWLLMLVLTAPAHEVKSMIKIPYNAKATAHCYDKIQSTRAPYREAVAQMKSTIESQSSFQEKFDRVLALHQQALQSKGDSEAEFQQIDVFLCCIYDMLQALYADESEKIVASSNAADQKKTEINELMKSIGQLPFGGPQYRTGIKPRLERIVKNAQKKLNS